MRHRLLAALLLAAGRAAAAQPGADDDAALEAAVQAQQAGRCPEAEPVLAARAAVSARAAYFLGVCRQARRAHRDAADAFDRAARDPDWLPVARLMRGIARFSAGLRAEARADLRGAAEDPALAEELRATARELLEYAGSPRAVQGAAILSAEYDSNVLQAPVVALPGLETVPSPVATAAAALVWTAREDLQARATLLQRQVFLAPEASVGGLLAALQWRRPGRWEPVVALDAAGYLLDWTAFCLLAQLRAELDWRAGRVWTLAAALRGRRKLFAGEWAGQDGWEAGGELWARLRLGDVTGAAGADHLLDRTALPDFQRDADTVLAELRWQPGRLALVARGSLGSHRYLHADSLLDRDGVRTARRDRRWEATVGAERLFGAWALGAEAAWTANQSSIAAYDHRRALVRLEVSRGF